RCLLMKVASAAKVGMLADGGRFSGMAGRLIGADKGTNAFTGQSADLDSAGGHRFSLSGRNCTIELEHTEAGSEALFGVGPTGKNGDDETFGLWPD
ncbi:hypothetical protein, partial [Brucella anthropi]|uniref:hypothetical protein n=1 Tax=Brucella anthropi TaxID=529 RepID=UPI00235E0FEB